jgi:hypothetical protein
MKRTQACLSLLSLVFLVLVVPSSVRAQAWAGIVDPSRAVDWTQAGIPGGIPSGSWTRCTTGTGTSVIAAYSGTAATINTAITGCNANHYVELGAGTFNLSSGINMASNVALRGQGANSTFLVFTGTASCGYAPTICVGTSMPSPGDEKNVCDWTAGYSPGTTVITLANCGTTTPAKGSLSNLAVGSLLILDQVDEAADTGKIWNCATLSSCSNDPPGGGERTNGPTVSGISYRSQQQTVTVTNIAGANITISPGLYMPNWRSGQVPQAWYGTTYLTNTGIENFSLDGSAVAGYNIAVVACSKCWVKGVRSMWAGRSHITMDASAHSELRDNYFYQSETHASVSYGVEMFWAASNNVIENNISQQITDSMPNCNGGCEGNVLAYNFSLDDEWTQSAGWMQGALYQHASGDAYNLWEGNIGPGYTADDVHGTHHFETLFRNYLIGDQNAGCGDATTANPCVKQTVPVNLYAGSRYINVIGNVLGRAGYHTAAYACVALSNANCPNGGASSGYDKVIYELGYTGNGAYADTSITGYCLQPGCSTHGSYDPQVSSYLMRWGNYDVFTAAVRWCGNSSDTGWSTTCGSTSEVPTAISPYGNALPTLGDTAAGQGALPTSFYLSTKPTWWGSLPFPGIGPDITDGNISGVAGHANTNPAMNCYLNVMGGPANGTGNVLSFNANTCYGQQVGSQLPAPPTILNAVVEVQ